MDVSEKVKKMNELIMKNSPRGQLEEFYDKNATKQENDGPETDRKSANENMGKMLADIKSASYKVVSSLTGNDLSMTEWAIKFKMKNGKDLHLNQVAVQRWKNGKIVKERYYHPDIKM